MKTIIGKLKSAKSNPSPQIDCYMPEGNSNGIGLIIFPGGGYGGLAEHEGVGYAKYFSERGIACFVVKYRLGSEGFRHPAMLEDALSAIQVVRASADEFNIEKNKIGIMGSSAGGHLTAHALYGWKGYKSDVSLRADFAVLCYPVITNNSKFMHEGSFINLTGGIPEGDLKNELSCEKNITSDTPPCFIWHTYEDIGVMMENSMLFASELRNNNVPFELHIYEKGGHGLGLNANFNWGEDCLRWIKETTKI
jgi:acetyl esterase/lipase